MLSCGIEFPAGIALHDAAGVVRTFLVALFCKHRSVSGWCIAQFSMPVTVCPELAIAFRCVQNGRRTKAELQDRFDAWTRSCDEAEVASEEKDLAEECKAVF